MKELVSIAKYTLIENVRNKIFYSLVMFGIILIAASFLLAALGGEQPVRILLDLGLNAIEFIALITVVFAAVTLILEEIETKTLYLILTRPVPRYRYLIGRYAGLLMAVYTGMAIMAIFHMGILFLNGWAFTPRYFTALFFSIEKITIIGSIALFFSLFSTSAVSSVTFTVFLWILGHFSEELKFLGNRASNIAAKLVAYAAYYLTPNLQFFNIRDFWDVPDITGIWMASAFVYGLVYSVFFLALSVYLFEKKEF